MRIYAAYVNERVSCMLVRQTQRPDISSKYVNMVLVFTEENF